MARDFVNCCDNCEGVEGLEGRCGSCLDATMADVEDLRQTALRLRGERDEARRIARQLFGRDAAERAAPMWLLTP